MTALDEVAGRLDEALGAGRVRRRVDIGTLTTYRVGGAAEVFVELDSEEELLAVASAVEDVRCAGGDVAVLVVGRGSNLLVADTGFAGVALRLGEGFASITIDDVTVRCGGAAPLPAVARRTAAEGLSGFEWAVGVPGSVGGAVRMNAGGHGSDMAASLVDARIVDLAGATVATRSATDLALGYRSSALGADDVVTSATISLVRGERGAAEEEIAAIVRWRRDNQPGGQNAGSVFVNPAGDAAGRLIDLAGCKGLRIGSAEVSMKHANFIQVDPGGSAADVRELMATVAEQVRRHSGVVLRAETRLVGFDEQDVDDGHDDRGGRRR
ncbi:MAG: UDP-N-acetylmuramate dehydrogenase [Acidimicrobiales bacterium]